MKIPTYFLLIFLPALISIIGFLLPNILSITKIYIVVISSLIYFFVVTIYLHLQLTETKNQIRNNKFVEQNLNEKMRQYETFRNKRDLFIKYDLTKIESLLSEYEGYIKDMYREKKYQNMKSEYKLVRIQVANIITKEKREYDEQIHEFYSYKDN